MRCPYCRHLGVAQAFELEGGRVYDVRDTSTKVQAGLRRCPNPTCFALLVVVLTDGGDVRVLPPEVIDFDATDLPSEVLECLTEAVMCHANGCYRAAATMIRRTLDETCHEQGFDQKAAVTLQGRMDLLARKVSLPAELVPGLADLKLLGNDGAHVKAKNFDPDQEEVRLGLEVAKDILRHVYQLGATVAKLAARKKT